MSSRVIKSDFFHPSTMSTKSFYAGMLYGMYSMGTGYAYGCELDRCKAGGAATPRVYATASVKAAIWPASLIAYVIGR